MFVRIAFAIIFAFIHGNLLADDELAAAQKAKVALEATDERFAAGMQRLTAALDKAIESIPASGTNTDFANELEAIVLLSRMNDQLIKECDPVLAAQEEYLALGRQYISDLKTAAPTFKAAADKCRAYAAEESYSDHREDYMAMAGILDELASRCSELPKNLSTQVKAVEELFPYLQNGRRVLDRFQKVLAAIPVLKSTREFEALDLRLKAYVRHYEEFRGSLRKLHQRLESERPIDLRSSVAISRPRPVASAPTNREPTSATQYPWSASDEKKFRVDRTAASSPFEDDLFPPSRDILHYVIPGAANKPSESDVPAGTAVRVGSSFHVRTRELGTVLLAVSRKLNVSDDGQTQYWLAELNSNRRSVPIAK